MYVELDGRQMTTRSSAHEHLKKQLQLPDYYGRNLDALYDLLTDLSEPTTIHLLHQDALCAALGNYGDMLIRALMEAAQSNPLVKIISF